jgi:NADH-quinone oxidoreductase subunit L
MANAWYVDESYGGFMGGPGRKLFEGLAWFDRNVVDGAVRGIASVVQSIGSILRVLQPGFVRSYALGVSLFTALIMAWFVGRLY